MREGLLRSVLGATLAAAVTFAMSAQAAEQPKPEDIKTIFDNNFFFGCEADDRLNTLAFDTRLNHLGARLNAIFGSDIGHWDVPDMTKVLGEAYEMVEDGFITEDDFRDFTCGNVVRMQTGMNPDFYKGTAVENDIAPYKASGGAVAAE